MTYDDVADIKLALQAIVLLLERMSDTLDRIEDNLTDIASALTPDDPEPPP